jgi:hypothetical protein
MLVKLAEPGGLGVRQIQRGDVSNGVSSVADPARKHTEILRFARNRSGTFVGRTRPSGVQHISLQNTPARRREVRILAINNKHPII